MRGEKNLKNSVVISIRPEWCRKILRGEKTLEVRKTKPNLDMPFKCYIYCTLSGSPEFFRNDLKSDLHLWYGEKWYDRKGNVVGEFTCNKLYLYSAVWKGANSISDHDMLSRSCLTTDEIVKYENAEVNAKTMTLKCGVWAWEISDLVLYDNPIPLSELGVKHAPQSWAYCEELAA